MLLTGEVVWTVATAFNMLLTPIWSGDEGPAAVEAIFYDRLRKAR